MNTPNGLDTVEAGQARPHLACSSWESCLSLDRLLDRGDEYARVGEVVRVGPPQRLDRADLYEHPLGAGEASDGGLDVFVG